MKKRTLIALMLGLVIPNLASKVEAHAVQDDFESQATYDYVDNDPNHRCYFENKDGTIFEFEKIYSLKEGETFNGDVSENSYCKGIVCRPTTEPNPFFVHAYDDEHDTTISKGEKFEFNGKEYYYALVHPNYLMVGDNQRLWNVIVEKEPMAPDIIACYDYNMDGTVRIDDFVLMRKNYMSVPYNFITNTDPIANEEMDLVTFYKILNYHYKRGETEIRICFGDTVPNEERIIIRTAATEATTLTTTTTTTTAIIDVTTETTTEITTEATTETETTTTEDIITTTSTTIESTTTSDITTTTTTTTAPDEWTPPRKEDIYHNGEEIPEDTYNILLNTAKFFGIDKFEIRWSDHPLEYAYTDPGLFCCMRNGIAYGYGVQVVPGTDISKIAENINPLTASVYEKYNYIAFRPLVDDDNNDYVLRNFWSSESSFKTDENVILKIKNVVESEENKLENESNYVSDLEIKNEMNSFQFCNWYLIPIDESRQKRELNLNYDNFDINVQAGATSKYWIDNTQLYCGDEPISRLLFNRYLDTAKQFDMPGFKIKYNNSEKEPMEYSFIGTDLKNVNSEIAVQVIPTNDILQLVDVYAITLKELNGDEKLAEMFYLHWISKLYNPHYYWTKDSRSEENVFFKFDRKDNYKNYVLVPLDENGNEDLRLYLDK